MIARSHTQPGNLDLFGIGGFLNSGAFAFTSLIDEVSVWQIARHTAAYTPATSPIANNTAGLTGLYHLDGNVTAAPAA